jgi:CubicO group peptidase (beta-lactamase class C family)
MWPRLAAGADGGRFPGAQWERHPEARSGGAAEGLRALRRGLESSDTTALVAVVGGRILFEYGDTAHLSYLASARKSVLAMLYGKYVQDGTIRLGDDLARLGIDDVGGLSAQERSATVEDLLTARSGIYHPAANSGDDSAFAPARGSVAPGNVHLYNNWDFNAAGAVFERATGRDIYDALATDLAAPLHMQDFDRAQQRKSGDASKSRFLAYHMRLSTRDMARLGLLMLRGGRWQERQVMPAGWSERITRLVTRHDDLIADRRRRLAGRRWGYGYMWWVWDAQAADEIMAGAYDAQGLFGQHITVIPRLDMVVAHKVDPRYGLAEGNRRRRVRAAQYADILAALAQARCAQTDCR